MMLPTERSRYANIKSDIHRCAVPCLSAKPRRRTAADNAFRRAESQRLTSHRCCHRTAAALASESPCLHTHSSSALPQLNRSAIRRAPLPSP